MSDKPTSDESPAQPAPEPAPASEPEPQPDSWLDAMTIEERSADRAPGQIER